MSSLFLQFQNVAFTYPTMTKPLLTGLDVHFPCGWTGIVGANGVGKSTLLKLAVGELAAQSGKIFHLGSARYCAQRTDEPPSGWDEFSDAAEPEAFALKRQLHLDEDWRHRWDTLSHGERKRLQIAVALWMDPDVLALDEPTNHIDGEARRLLAGALHRYRGVGLLVSHDRDLLDELCGQCLFLDPPGAIVRPGGVTQGAEQADLELETARRDDNQAKQAIHRLRQETQRRREASDRFAAKVKIVKNKKPPMQDHDGRAKRNLAKLTGKDAFAGKLITQLGSRVRRAGEERSRIKVQKVYEMGIWLEDNACSHRAHLCRLPAGELLLGGNRRLLFPELLIRPTDRIALTGANGLGKSTLLKQLLRGYNACHGEKAIGGRSSPTAAAAEDSRPPGQSVMPDMIQAGHGLSGIESAAGVAEFAKPGEIGTVVDSGRRGRAEAGLNIEPERVVYVPQEISSAESKRIFGEVAALAKDRLGQIMTIVSRLGSRPQRLLESDEPSPGEIRKILLALGIAKGPHLIVMDEPTNHMDLPSIECLEDALSDCPCGLLLVSHDRRFLNALTAIDWHIAAMTAEVSQLTISLRGME